MIDKRSSKVKPLQQLAGLLNFLNRAIVLGRAFTRRMYEKFSGFAQVGPNNAIKADKHVSVIKQHHHIKLDQEFKADCKMWLRFLAEDSNTHYTVCCPFADLSGTGVFEKLQFFSDASAGETRGFGCYFDLEFTLVTWEDGFIQQYKSSIALLRAVCSLRGGAHLVS